MGNRKFKIYRGDNTKGELVDYNCDITEGMVVLDAMHRIQADDANDMACRWNCKAGKCGSCSVEINGRPKLACMTRMNEYDPEQTITITPLKAFPIIKDTVTDVSWNYKQNLKIKTFLGTSKNAVLSQIWVAMIYTLLLAYIKFQTKSSFSILKLSRIFSESLFFRRHLIDLLGLSPPNSQKIPAFVQLKLC